MNVLSWMDRHQIYVIIGLMIGIFVLLMFCLVLAIRIGKMKKVYHEFIQGKDGKSLESVIIDELKEVQCIKGDLVEIKKRTDSLEEKLVSTYQKMGIVKYDAFKETGGKLSFSLALLNEDNSGFVINSMHSGREGCYTYVKEVIHGESFITLSNEEKEAIIKAMNQNNYME